jgi:hypothetical protein
VRSAAAINWDCFGSYSDHKPSRLCKRDGFADAFHGGTDPAEAAVTQLADEPAKGAPGGAMPTRSALDSYTIAGVGHANSKARRLS